MPADIALTEKTVLFKKTHRRTQVWALNFFYKGLGNSCGLR